MELAEQDPFGSAVDDGNHLFGKFRGAVLLQVAFRFSGPEPSGIAVALQGRDQALHLAQVSMNPHNVATRAQAPGFAMTVGNKGQALD